MRKPFSILDRFTASKPFATKAVARLRDMSVTIDSTTGYADSMISVAIPEAARQG